MSSAVYRIRVQRVVSHGVYVESGRVREATYQGMLHLETLCQRDERFGFRLYLASEDGRTFEGDPIDRV